MNDFCRLTSSHDLRQVIKDEFIENVKEGINILLFGFNKTVGYGKWKFVANKDDKNYQWNVCIDGIFEVFWTVL